MEKFIELFPHFFFAALFFLIGAFCLFITIGGGILGSIESFKNHKTIDGIALAIISGIGMVVTAGLFFMSFLNALGLSNF
jgi:hypothetical protein